MDSKKLLRHCKKGDPKAFELLVHHYSPMLHSICKRYVIGSASAKDALQECLISIFRGIGSYKEVGSFEAWMKRIAVTSSLKELRKNKKQTLSLSSLAYSDNEIISEDPVILDKLNVDEVLEVINELPQDFRIAFNLFVIEGFSHKEIAILENIDETVSRVRVSRARKKVKELLLKNQAYYGFASARKVD